LLLISIIRLSAVSHTAFIFEVSGVMIILQSLNKIEIDLTKLVSSIGNSLELIRSLKDIIYYDKGGTYIKASEEPWNLSVQCWVMKSLAWKVNSESSLHILCNKNLWICFKLFHYVLKIKWSIIYSNRIIHLHFLIQD